MSTIVDRLQIALQDKKMSWSKASVAIGLSPQAPAKWKKGQISKDTVEKLATLLEVDVGWLLTGKETKPFKTLSFDEIKKRFNQPNTSLNEMLSDIGVYEYGDPVPDGYTAIDYFPEVRASAGNGYINLEESSPYKIFIPTIEVVTSGASAPHCKIINVDGESMIPDLYPDQKISLDLSAKKIYDGEIYAFTKGSELKIKILFNWGEEGQGGFRAVSRNPDKVRFPDEYYSPAQIESENIHIIGQYWMKIDIRKVRR
jgi:phage repressor protein C with HTH and peptisase S24 domain